MALTSVGYAGSVTSADWADLTAAFGAQYGVLGAGDWKVTTVAGQDRTVSIAAGSGFGHGILDTTDAAQTVQLGTVGSGSRWDTIVARRTWSTPATVLMAVQGTSTQGLAASRQANPGVVDDQPIALVQVTAGQQLPTSVVDLRCWRGNGGMTAASEDALAYLTSPGSVIWVNGVEWVRQVASNGSISWVRAEPVDVVDGALAGTYQGQQVKRRVRARSFTTDGNGDVIIMPAADFAGVLTAHMVAASTYELTFSVRIVSGNLVARVWTNGTVRTNTTFAAVADVLYW